MNKHLVLVSDFELEDIVSGKAGYLVKFFKERSEVVSEITAGDLVYFKKSKGEVLGQFEIGKTIQIERLGIEDWELLKGLGGEKVGLSKEVFKEKAGENSVVVIVKIDKLEQLIASPIEVPRGRKEWVMLG